MGTVYLARSHGIGGFESDVALKVTHAHLRDEPDFAQVLLDEANVAVRIRHRNVVAILDLGDDPHGIYLVMEYVEGDTLGGLRRRGKSAGTPLPIGVGIRILLDALAGLHAAHEATNDDGDALHIVHRDFTPANVLVGLDGVGRLTDFGVAKASTRISQTASGIVKGKLGYMSPQQAKGEPLDRRADIWAAGVVAWELFTDRRLFTSGDDVSTLLKIVSEPPPLLSTVVPSIGPGIERAVAKALAANPDERWPTAAAFARELGVACRRELDVAEHEEVAEWVKRLAGGMLGERRARLRALRDARPKGGRISSPAIGEGSGSSSSGVAVRQPSQPDIVASPLAPPPVPPPVPPPLPPRLPPPLPSRDPVGFPASDGQDTDATSVSDSLRGLRQATTSVRDLLRSLKTTVPQNPVPLLFAFSGLVLFVTLVLLVRARPLRDTTAAPDGRTATATAKTESGAKKGTKERRALEKVAGGDVVAALAAGIASSHLEAEPPVEIELPATPVAGKLVVESNAPIRSLRIDSEPVAILAPTTRLVLDVPGDLVNERRAEAIAVDGRRAQATLAPDATTVRFEFDPPVARSAPAPSTTTSTAPARPETKPKPARPLAPSPYH